MISYKEATSHMEEIQPQPIQHSHVGRKVLGITLVILIIGAFAYFLHKTKQVSPLSAEQKQSLVEKYGEENADAPLTDAEKKELQKAHEAQGPLQPTPLTDAEKRAIINQH